jgi:chorismate mutase/prephenate dehydratase
MNSDKSLDALRREIDSIDDAIHNRLMRRADLTEQIRDVKGGGATALRPGREAEILRRLVARHKGIFPKPSLVRIWREIFAANVSLQGPFSLAVFTPAEGGDGYLDLARDQFGSYTPMTDHQSSYRVIDLVTRGQAAVGIMPLPQPDDAAPWWPHLVGEGKNSPRIVARLPFAGPANGRGRDLEGLAISRLAQEETGADRTFIAVDFETKIDPPKLRRAFAKASLKATVIAFWADNPAGPWLHLAEIEGFIAPDDARLGQLVEAAGDSAQRAMVLGGYAVPFGADALRPQRRSTGKIGTTPRTAS